MEIDTSEFENLKKEIKETDDTEKLRSIAMEQVEKAETIYRKLFAREMVMKQQLEQHQEIQELFRKEEEHLDKRDFGTSNFYLGEIQRLHEKRKQE